MGFLSQVTTKVRNVVNKVRRPSSVTKAQKQSVILHPSCAACGYVGLGLQGHHIQPYNKFPGLADHLDNFITLCEHVGGLECHLHVGHGGDFKHYNPSVVQDAADFLAGDPIARAKILAKAREARLVDEPS